MRIGKIGSWHWIYLTSLILFDPPTKAAFICAMLHYCNCTNWSSTTIYLRISFRLNMSSRLQLSEQLCGRGSHIRQHDVKRFFKWANILHALRQSSWMQWNRDSHMPWMWLYVCSLRLCFDSWKSPNLDDLWVGSLHWRWLPLILFLFNHWSWGPRPYRR